MSTSTTSLRVSSRTITFLLILSPPALASSGGAPFPSEGAATPGSFLSTAPAEQESAEPRAAKRARLATTPMQFSSSSPAASAAAGPRPAAASPAAAIIFLRHGMREDYEQLELGRANGRGSADGRVWIQHSDRPWDTPLARIGQIQAQEAGKEVAALIELHGLPPLRRVYSSPFRRTVETAACAVEGYNAYNDVGEQHYAGAAKNRPQVSQISIEPGLSEHLARFWYNAWAMEGSDGYGGEISFNNAECSLNEHAKGPASLLLHSPEELDRLLRSTTFLESSPVFSTRGAPGGAVPPRVVGISPAVPYEHFDRFHVGNPEPVSESAEQISLGRVTKSARYHAPASMGNKADVDTPEEKGGETVLFVSHGGPCTEAVVGLRHPGDSSAVAHPGYTAISVMVPADEQGAESGKGFWKALERGGTGTAAEAGRWIHVAEPQLARAERRRGEIRSEEMQPEETSSSGQSKL